MDMLRKILYRLNGNYYLISINEEANKMSVALNYQLSIFGRYSIAPNPEMITNLMSKINTATGETFLPNIINTQQVEVSSNQIKSLSNLGFVTPDQKFSISILNERVDINFTRTTDIDVEIDTFFNIAVKALETIMDYANLNAYRLAANYQMVCNLQDFDKLQILGKRFVTAAKYYDSKALYEWSNRVNSQVEINIMDAPEGINVITEISSAHSVHGQHAVLYHIDINTLPQNQNMRFSSVAISSFVGKVTPIAKEIVTDVEGLIANE